MAYRAVLCLAIFCHISLTLALQCYTCIDSWTGYPDRQEDLLEKWKSLHAKWSGSVTEHCVDPTKIDYVPVRSCPDACFSVYFYATNKSYEQEYGHRLKDLVARGCFADFFPERKATGFCKNFSTPLRYDQEVYLTAELCSCSDDENGVCNRFRIDEINRDPPPQSGIEKLVLPSVVLLVACLIMELL